MSAFNETTLGSHDEATVQTYIEGVEELPPLVSPGILSSEQRDQIIKMGMREIFREKLQERWGCNESGHDLCYWVPGDEQHIALSASHIEVWVDEWLNVVSSFIGPVVSLILTHTNLDWYLLASGEGIIELTLKLITASSEPESACTTLRSLDAIATLVSLLPHCDKMRSSSNGYSISYTLKGLDLIARSFLCVVATPSTRVSAGSN
ncbi:hypothetical protein BU17DRAFT_89950 [Hysterangium stoloniferum]|nr:hypothetical protein BU17DRAFT_89950 [Hysterangium stoloniferum]